MKIKFFVEVISTATTRYVELNKKEIICKPAGDNKSTGSKELEIIDGLLDLYFEFRGISGTSWKITVTCKDIEKPIFKDAGVLERGKYSDEKTIKIPEQPKK